MLQAKIKFKFLDWLRCIGICMIIYDHLGPLRNPDWLVAKAINHLINIPLGIIQDFGALGVCLFFVISGFLLDPNNVNGTTFLFKKFSKIMLTTLAASIAFFLFNNIISIIFQPTYWTQFSNKDWFEGCTLLCYMFGKENSINGALWYLFPLLFSELAFGLFYKFIQKSIIYFALILDSFFLILILWVKYSGNLGLGRTRWLIFSLIPVFGVLIRAVYDNKVSIIKFTVFFSINYLIFLNGIIVFRPHFYSEQPYIISLAYSLLIFGLFLLLEKKLTLPTPIKFISDISFSIYLTHMTFGSLVMSILEKKVSTTLSFSLAICFTVLLAWAHYKWIETRIGIMVNKCLQHFNISTK